MVEAVVLVVTVVSGRSSRGLPGSTAYIHEVILSELCNQVIHRTV